jgi:hypothetical protein
MARPAALLCDTDALIQLLLIGEIRPLRLLRNAYSCQPLIVPEVELELRSNRKFGRRIAPELKKALSHNLLEIIDKPVLERCYGSSNSAMVATAALGKIASLGRTYEQHADRGEAYTHAAALTLSAPVMSNDLTALRALTAANLAVPATVLRTFDLIALCRQVNEMSDGECEDFRRSLLSEREHVPKCFMHHSFANGLAGFYPRLIDGGATAIGAQGNVGAPFSTVIVL